MTEVEPVVEPDCVTNDIGRESVAFVCIHLPILSILESLLGNTLFILVPHRFDLIAAYGFITVLKLRENIPNLMIRTQIVVFMTINIRFLHYISHDFIGQ
jgi:hypothetical protein